MNTLSVLICTHNRAGLLKRTLASLNAARRPPAWKVSILAVANACSDTTTEWLTAYAADAPQDGRLPLRWVEAPIPGKSHALNTVIPLIEAPMVAFVDDDHRVDDGYLLGVCQAFERYPNAALFCGRILPDWDGTEPAWVHDRGPYRIYPLPVPRFDLGDEPRSLGLDTALPGGGNLFLYREWFAKVGPFAIDYGPVGHNLRGAEDLEWIMRALRLGARLQYVPDVIQHHFVDKERLTLSYLAKKAYERSACSVRLGEGERGRVPPYMYRKLLNYFFCALTAFGRARRRFYLVRFAAALGEVRGYLQSREPQGDKTESLRA